MRRLLCKLTVIKQYQDIATFYFACKPSRLKEDIIQKTKFKMTNKFYKYTKFHHVLSFKKCPGSVNLFQYFKQHTLRAKLIMFQDKCL